MRATWPTLSGEVQIGPKNQPSERGGWHCGSAQNGPDNERSLKTKT
jgi:hypothetical protein